MRRIAPWSPRLRVTILLTLIASSSVVAAEEDASCPPRLHAWRFFGNIPTSLQWTAQTLEIRDDVAVFRDLLIRFTHAGVDVEHARWFDVPDAAWPEMIFARTVGISGDELRDYCVALSGSSIETLQKKARPRCLVNAEGQRMIARTSRGMITVTDEPAVASSAPLGIGIGVSVGDDPIDEDTLECKLVEKLELAADRNSLDATAPDVIGFVDAMMERLSAIDSPEETGLAATATARQVMGTLREHDGERIPPDLPSEFSLELAAASAPHATALATERMLRNGDPDELLALATLAGAEVAPEVDVLRMKLRASVADNHLPAIGLTLRALLATDQRTARMEALTLLDRPALLRPALGVFALTDISVNEMLDSLDTTDSDALEKAAQDVLAYLASAATEEGIRKAAAEQLGR